MPVTLSIVSAPSPTATQEFAAGAGQPTVTNVTFDFNDFVDQ